MTSSTEVDPQDPDFDRRLWVKVRGEPERLFLLGPTFTYPGRISAWIPSEGTTRGVSRDEIEAMSELTAAWVDGVVAGTAMPPPANTGDRELHDRRMRRWRETVVEYRRRGTWPPTYGLEEFSDSPTLLAELTALPPEVLVDSAFEPGRDARAEVAMLALRLDGQHVWYPLELDLQPWSVAELTRALDLTAKRGLGLPPRLSMAALRRLVEAEHPDARELVHLVIQSSGSDSWRIRDALRLALSFDPPDHWDGYAVLLNHRARYVRELASELST
ncbi:MAG: hypothetical protein GY713_10770 [Actinomycetia bacterium]|nr:hypothetical protein [Actinomycetes bacterium]